MCEARNFVCPLANTCVLDKDPCTNLPTEEAVRDGLFAIRWETCDNGITYPTPGITRKGIIEICQKLVQEGELTQAGATQVLKDFDREIALANKDEAISDREALDDWAESCHLEQS